MKMIRKWFKQLKVRFKEETGIGLVESLAAVAILGTAGIAFVLSLSTGAVAVRESDQETVAQSLARAQLEYVKNYPYHSAPTSYPYVYTYNETYNPNPVTLPEGYDISLTSSTIPQAGGNSAIQKITVIISRNGEDILTLADYKVKR
jgi:type II secretory pathway pseudopilin PulG